MPRTGDDVSEKSTIGQPPWDAGAVKVKVAVAVVVPVAATAVITALPGFAADACAAIKSDTSAAKMFNGKKHITRFIITRQHL